MTDFIWRAVQGRALFLLGIVAVVTLSKLSLLVPPLMLGRIIDDITNPGRADFSAGWICIVLFLAAGLFQAVITPVQTVLLNRFVQNTICNCSIAWIKEILNKDFVFFESLRLGHMMKGVERGIQAHEKFLHFIITTALPQCVQIIAYGGLIIVVGGWIIFFPSL